jgi:hypothetical protein
MWGWNTATKASGRLYLTEPVPARAGPLIATDGACHRVSPNLPRVEHAIVGRRGGRWPERTGMPDQDERDGRQPRGIGVDAVSMFDFAPRRLGTMPDGATTLPKGDPALCRRSFEGAFARHEPRTRPNQAVALNALLLGFFGGEELLSLPEFVAAHDRLARQRAGRIERYPRPDPDPRAYEMAGMFAGQCVRLRLVAIAGTEAGLPRFRLLDREMQFVVRDRRAVRVRGLTRAEKDRRDRLDRQARDAATPEIGRLINELVRLDRDGVVPASWHAAGFLPEDLVSRGIAEAAAFIVGHHQTATFERAKVADWLACLASSVRQASRAPPVRGRGAPEADDLVSDVDALMAIARTKGAGSV